jgi:hypothetical protein
MTVLGFHGGGHCQPGHAETLRAAAALLAFDDMRQLPRLIGRIEANQPLRLHFGESRDSGFDALHRPRNDSGIFRA